MAVAKLPEGFVLDEPPSDAGLPPGFVLDEASQPQAQPSPARQIINAVFAPANTVRSGVTSLMQQGQQIAESLPGGRAAIEKAALFGPLTPLGFPATLLSRGGPEAVGVLASLPFDPTTYIGGAALSVPNRIARMVASGVVGAASPALQSYGQTGDVDVGISALGGLLGTVAGAVAKVNPRAVRTGEGSPVEFQSPQLPEILRNPKAPSTPEELLALPESEVAKLPALERSAYMRLQTLQQSQKLQAQRVQLAQEGQQIQQTIAAQRAGAIRELPAIAARRLQQFSGRFRELMQEQGTSYRQGVNDAIANAEMASGEPITFTRQELNQEIANKYLRPTQAGQPAVPQEDVTTYQTLTRNLSEQDIVNQNEIPARKLLNIADEFSQQSGWKKLQSGQPFTPSEVASQHLRDILLNLLEKRGIDVSSPKADWAEWVPVRNLGLKLQTPAGPNQLIRIVKGQDPVRAKNLQDLEVLAGEKLDTETRQAFNQLDDLNQQKVIEQTKLSERQRLLQEQAGLDRNSHIAKGLQIEQQARHRANVRKIIYGVLGATVSMTGGKQILKLLGR